MATLEVTSGWSDAFLEEMRQHGDPPADDAVAQVFAAGDLPAVRALMRSLVENDEVLPAALPPELQEYLQATAQVPAAELPRVEMGEQLFADHGPEIFILLLCYSLPATYAIRKGVPVLYRTGYLLRRPNRRLFETAQMIVDVMTPGGLAPGGKGIRTAQKVRLMHAAIRTLILRDRQDPWDPELGVPINQEDLAFTLMTFARLLPDGLQQLGIEVEPETQEAFLDAWRVVGRVMGIRPELLPADVAQARALTAAIERRQMDSSEEGRLMTQALLGVLEENSPPAFKGFSAALMHYLLPPGVATGLAVPEHRLEERLAAAAAHDESEVENRLDESTRFTRLIRRFNLELLQWMIDVDRGGQRAPFAIPDDLRKSWQLPAAHEPTFARRLWRWGASRLERSL